MTTPTSSASPPRASETSLDRCASCRAPLAGVYCAACGERRLRPDEFSLRRFAGDALNEITGGSTSRLWRSIRALALQPGRLTREFMEGRRKPWLRPLQVFLLANLAYFFIQPLTSYNTYNTPLYSQLNRQVYSEMVDLASVVGAQVETLDMTVDTYRALYDRQSETLARSLVILLVPLSAMVLALLLLWRRRPFVQHLVFALHFQAWNLVFVMSLFLLVYKPFLTLVIAGFESAGVDFRAALDTTGIGNLIWHLITEFQTIPLWLGYLYLGLRRAYDLGRAAAGLVAVALAIALLQITIVYRLLLFWATVWSL